MRIPGPSSRRKLLALWLLVVAAIAPVAWNDACAAGKSNSEEVEALIQRGLRLRKAGDDAGALPELQKAHELAASPRTAAQLGLVEQALGRWDEAEGHLAVAIRSTGDPWVEKHRESLQSAMVIVRGHIGSVQITGEPAGAEAYINGRLVGRLPLNQPITVIAGDVDVELRAEGYQKRAEKIAVAVNQHKPLVMRLEKREAAASPAAPDAKRVDAPSEDAPAGSGAVNVSPAPRTGSPPRPLGPIIGWSVAGVGLATTTVGVVEALLGQSKMDGAVADAKAANAMMNLDLYMNAQAKLSSGHSQRTLGIVVASIGGAVAVGGVIVALVTRHDPSAENTQTMSLQPWVGASGDQIALGGLKWSRTW
ncbi:MAG TPA: PEGA domain-containing protein [Polyangia bacterium]|nr:PEGA domain-containing protein [Polyangia bacterium]